MSPVPSDELVFSIELPPDTAREFIRAAAERVGLEFKSEDDSEPTWQVCLGRPAETRAANPTPPP